MIPIVIPVNVEQLKKWHASFLVKVQAFFSSRGLYRSRRDRIAGGVCAGVANRLRVHVGITRIVVGVGCAVMPIMIVAYLLLWWLMPQEP